MACKPSIVSSLLSKPLWITVNLMQWIPKKISDLVSNTQGWWSINAPILALLLILVLSEWGFSSFYIFWSDSVLCYCVYCWSLRFQWEITCIVSHPIPNQIYLKYSFWKLSTLPFYAKWKVSVVWKWSNNTANKTAFSNNTSKTMTTLFIEVTMVKSF